MRPIIDLNNLWYSEETRIYNSRLEIVAVFIIQIVIFLLFFFSLMSCNYLLSIIILSPTFFLVKKIKKLIVERNQVQLTINSNGIQIKNEKIISWDNIKNERIVRIGNNKNSRHDFVFYNENQHKKMRFRTDLLNFDHDEIIKSVKIHRERFNRKTNPN